MQIMDSNDTNQGDQFWSSFHHVYESTLKVYYQRMLIGQLSSVRPKKVSGSLIDIFFATIGWSLSLVQLVSTVNVILFYSSETEKVQFAPLKMPDTGAVSFVLLKTRISPICSSFPTLLLYYGDFRIVFVLRTVIYVLSSLSSANTRRSVPPYMICRKLTFFTFIFTSPY